MGTQLPSPTRGQIPSPIFGQSLLWLNGWMHQDATQYGGRPQPRRVCVRWGHSPLPKKGAEPQFLAHAYCGQTSGWIKMPLDMEEGLGPSDFVLDGDAALPAQNGGGAPLPNFRPMRIIAKRLDGSRSYLAWRYRPQPRRPYGVRWGPSLSPKRGQSPLPNFWQISIVQTAGCTKMPLGMELGLSPADFVLDGDTAPSPKRGRSPPKIF